MRWNRRESHMQCRAALTRIDALRTRELAPIEQTAVDQHLKTCRSCNDSTSDVDALRAPYAKRYGRELAPAPLPEPLRRQVVAALTGEGVDAPRVDLEPTNDLEHD